MSKTARRARIAAVIELLCDRFPQTFSRRSPQPLKVGVYADVLTALGDAVQPRDLQSAEQRPLSASLVCRREKETRRVRETRSAASYDAACPSRAQSIPD